MGRYYPLFASAMCPFSDEKICSNVVFRCESDFYFLQIYQAYVILQNILTSAEFIFSLTRTQTQNLVIMVEQTMKV